MPLEGLGKLKKKKFNDLFGNRTSDLSFGGEIVLVVYSEIDILGY
jgi:hypothetical protein